jgi:hypothetical protein
MNTEISLERLFEEQNKPAEQMFVILPLDDEFIRMRPWNPSKRCICSGGFEKVPRSAIRSVKTTGKMQHCCGRSLQVVAVDFSEEPMLTFKNLFAALRRSGRAISAPIRLPRKPRAIKRPIHVPILFPPFPSDPSVDESGGFTGDPDEDMAKYQACVRECVAQAVLLDEGGGTRTPQQSQQWLQQIKALCGTNCLAYLSAGLDDGDDGDDDGDE